LFHSFFDKFKCVSSADGTVTRDSHALQHSRDHFNIHGLVVHYKYVWQPLVLVFFLFYESLIQFFEEWHDTVVALIVGLI